VAAGATTAAVTMTERTPRKDGRSGPAAGGAGRTSSRPASARSSHPLLGAFPLSVMAFAAFLVAFTLMMARLTSAPGAGSSPAPGASAATVLAAGTRTPLSSRSSGAAASAAPAAGGAGAGSAVASSAPAASTPAILSTRTSGAVGAEGGHDD
jgi:hypothetical protein